MDDFERKEDENREWSDEEFYQKEVDNNRLQEDAVGSDDELYKNYKDDGATNQDENIPDLPSRVTCSIPKAQDSSSDDDIPIAMMITRCISKKKEKEPVRRKLIDDDIDEEDDFMDDNSLDKSYDPSKDDCNSTDSEAVEIKKSRKKKRKRSKQDEASSNRTKKLKLKLQQSIKVLQNSRKRQNRMAGSSSCTVERALHISKKMQSLKNHIRDIHYARLINLLAYNERKLVKVNADGNCFFAAVAACIEDYTFDDLTEFRQSLCDFMLQKKENYIQFMAFDSDSCNQQEIFVNEVNNLRQSGQWNTHLADCLPLAIADKFNRIVRIYSSSVSSPIINIKPSSWSKSESYKLIEVAHVAIRQEEHYEGTASITQQIQTERFIITGKES